MHESVHISHCVGMHFSQFAFNHSEGEVMDLTGVSGVCFSADCSSAGGISPEQTVHPPEKKR